MNFLRTYLSNQSNNPNQILTLLNTNRVLVHDHKRVRTKMTALPPLSSLKGVVVAEYSSRRGNKLFQNIYRRINALSSGLDLIPNTKITFI